MNTTILWGVQLAAALLLAPLCPGIINKVKAFFAGRKGPRLCQLYFDLAKLLRKGTVYSTGVGMLFRLAPWINLAAVATALALLPALNGESPLGFAGDPVLLVYLLGLGRTVTVLAALETGSSFEGMGSARELQYSVLCEGTLFLVLGFLAWRSDSFSLAGFLCGPGVHTFSLIPAAFALFFVLLAENCRVPADDPETHLELTMIHEAMILDAGGPDLAVIHYTASLKLWLFGALIALMTLPAEQTSSVWGFLGVPAAIAAIMILVGVTESMMARFRLNKVPQFLAFGFGLGILALMIHLLIEGGLC